MLASAERIKKHKHKSSSKSKRSPSEERLYHGFVDKAMDAAGRPSLSAEVAGPLREDGLGAWGTIDRSCRDVSTPMSLSGFGISAVDGRKRQCRGGESEDGFSALLDLTNSPGSTTKERIDVEVAVSGRIFHLLGIFDGHRSDHAARFCAQSLGKCVAGCLESVCAAGLLRTSDAPESADAEAAEEAAVRKAFSDAVEGVDEDFCRQRYVAIVYFVHLVPQHASSAVSLQCCSGCSPAA